VIPIVEVGEHAAHGHRGFYLFKWHAKEAHLEEAAVDEARVNGRFTRGAALVIGRHVYTERKVEAPVGGAVLQGGPVMAPALSHSSAAAL
jgi:hypothetical protein